MMYFIFKRYLLYVSSFAVRIAVFNCLLIIFFCHLSIGVLCLPVQIDWIVVHNHSKPDLLPFDSYSTTVPEPSVVDSKTEIIC